MRECTVSTARDMVSEGFEQIFNRIGIETCRGTSCCRILSGRGVGLQTVLSARQAYLGTTAPEVATIRLSVCKPIFRSDVSAP